FFSRLGAPRPLHSFPTRRSSDLQAKEISDGGVDVVLDPVGGDRFTDSLRSLREGGRAVVVGFTGGSIPEVKVNRLLLNNIDVVGDRKSTRLNSSHSQISYAVFCL